MEGSIYPDGCLVSQVNLKRTEEAKSDHILRNRTDITSCGVFSGGTITVNAVTNTRIDVAQFSGYAPTGEYIETTQAYTSLALDDYTAGVDNYVVAVYTETTYGKSPHETDGQTYNTMSRGAHRIMVYSETNYLALPDTDANLANDAIDRALILGIVNANGVGVALTASDITHPTAFYNLLYATPNEPPSIPGVTIIGVSSDSNTGTGTLDYTYAVGPVYSLQWTDPGTGAGAVVNPTVDGTYILYGGVGGEHILVDVIISQLPLTTPHSESIVISNLYEQDIPRFTAHDHIHRNYIGTGILTPTNPHATSEEDITGSVTSALDEHQDVQHNNGIWRGSSANIFWPSVTMPPAADVLQLIAPAAGDLYYINGEKLTSVSPTSFEFLPATIPSSAAGCHFYEIYVDDNETSIVHLKASFPNPRNCSGTWIIDMSEDFPAGNYDLTISGGGAAPYGFELHLNGAAITGNIVYVPTTNPSQVVRVYDEEDVNWIDLWVNVAGAVGGDGDLPAVLPVTDTLVVAASLDRDENMQIHSLTGWWNAGGGPARFQIGYPPYAPVTRNVVDKRPYGTLCEENIADSFLQSFVFHPEDELHFSGVLLRRNGEYNEFRYTNVGAPSLDIHVSGGSYYCRGRRLTFEGDDVTLAANKIYLLYVDSDAALQTANITDDFAGNLYDAMEYILGSTKYVPDISNLNHYYDNTDPPERGVILYYVDTGAASIDTYCNMMRNVNGPVDPWSVAAHSDPVAAAATNGSISSAFDNLYSAFAYANLALTEEPLLTAGIDMRIVGYVDVDRAVTQPSNVRLWGTKADSTYSVEITHVSATGAWSLSSDCVVDGVYITNSAATGVCFEVDDDVIIRNCEYHENVGASYDYFLGKGGGGVGPNYRILVENNYVSTKGGLLINFEADPNEKIEITNNDIIQTGVGAGLANAYMVRLQVIDGYIGNNRVSIFDDNTSTIDPFGIYCDTCVEIVVENNNVELQRRDGSLSEMGIVLEDCTKAKVFKNSIYMSPTSNSDSATGIRLLGTDSTDVKVKDNNLNAIALGIHVTSSLVDVDISNNMLKNTSGHESFRGIYISTTSSSFKRVRVDNNDISGLYKTAAPTVGGWGNALYGISIVGSNAGVVTYEGISVCGNKIFNVDNDLVAAGADAVGIAVGMALTNGLTAIARNIRICDNDIDTVEGDTDDDSIGIDYITANNSSYNVNIDRNSVRIVTDNNTRPVVAGIRYTTTAGALGFSSINGNHVYISYSGAKGLRTGEGILISGAIGSSTIKENVVEATEVGIYANAATSTISDNEIKAYGVGLFVEGGDRDIIDGNVIRAEAFNPNIYNAVGGANAAYCIVMEDGAFNFTISNNRTWLYENSSNELYAESANIYCGVDAKNFKIEGNTTRQYYGSVPAGNTAYHIYVDVDGASATHPPEQEIFSIKNNDIDNEIDVPVPSDSHCLYINCSAADAEVLGHISGNTIISSCDGAISGSFAYDIYQSNFADILNMAPHVVYTSNTISNSSGQNLGVTCVFGAGAISPGTSPAGAPPVASGTNYFYSTAQSITW